MNDVSTGMTACLPIPAVPDFASGDWEATGRAMRQGVRLEFRQGWKTEPNPGEVWLGVIGDELVAYGVFRDDEPANRAKEWNAPTWMTGDVWEFFFQAEGRPGYYEFHVTPENCRLQLFFPDRASFHAKRGHRHWAIAESKFESAARVNEARTGWEAIMRVPLARVLDLPRTDGVRRFKFSFSRYDYQPGRDKPVTSATPKLSAPDFHNMDEWEWAEV
jgi:hypothetical protein